MFFRYTASDWLRDNKVTISWSKSNINNFTLICAITLAGKVVHLIACKWSYVERMSIVKTVTGHCINMKYFKIHCLT